MITVDPIGPDIRQAEALPAVCYTSRDFFDRCRERVWPRSWQWIGDVGQLAPIHPFQVGDEPLVRTPAGCFSNVCTHRGNVLVDEPCDRATLKCRYHGRHFGLDGVCGGAPGFDVLDERDNLPRIDEARWNRFAFASVDPAFPFADWTADLPDPGALTFAPERSRDFQLSANWILYVDNYLEGLHVPFVHPGLNEALDPKGYETHLQAWSNVQRGRDKDGAVAARYHWLFPNLMLNFYPWGLSVNVVEPLDVAATRVRFLTFVSDPTQLDSGAGADLSAVEFEDEAIVESVQRGMRSKLYRRGRYSPTHETGVHHFHRLLTQSL